MTNIIYLHGFNSNPGGKFKTLKKEFPECNVIAPTFEGNPIKYFQSVDILIGNLEGETIIVGTSLGAFFGLCLSTLQDVKCFLINTSYFPELSLSEGIGKTYINHKTNEEFLLTQEFVDELVTIRKDSGINKNDELLSNPNYYFSIKDEIINHSHLISRLDRINRTEKDLELHVKFEDQDHRFENIDSVVEDIKDYLK